VGGADGVDWDGGIMYSNARDLKLGGG